MVYNNNIKFNMRSMEKQVCDSEKPSHPQSSPLKHQEFSFEEHSSEIKQHEKIHYSHSKRHSHSRSKDRGVSHHSYSGNGSHQASFESQKSQK